MSFYYEVQDEISPGQTIHLYNVKNHKERSIGFLFFDGLSLSKLNRLKLKGELYVFIA
jgi:hypothetical protein